MASSYRHSRFLPVFHYLVGILLLVCAIPKVCLGNPLIDIAIYRLVTIDGIERMAKLPGYPVIKESDLIRIELESIQKLELTLSHTAPDSSIETVLYSQLIDKGRRIHIPAGDKWLDPFMDSAGKHSLTFHAKTDTGTHKHTLEFLLVEPDMLFFDPTRFETSSSQQNNLKLDHVGVTHSAPHLDHAIELLSETQSFVELEFLGTRGVNVYNEAAPSVVKLLTSDGTCSGAIVDRNGLIVTNFHCIGTKRETLLAVKPPRGIDYTFSDFFSADVIRVDEKRDLALLQIRQPPDSLEGLVLGNLSEIEVGMDAHAIGHPIGHNWSYTNGTVSQIRPDHVWRYGDAYPNGFSATVIQTQTPTNPGNSGGPLLSDAGKLIGINSFGDPKASGINFAVAINHVRDLINGIKSPDRSKPSKPVFLYSFDTNDNGITDTYVYDTNNNGKPDLYAQDLDEDNKPDYWLLDEDENGRFDGKILEDLFNGHPILVTLKDLDEDGDYDVQGLDFNFDGKIDRYVSLLDSS